MANKKGQSFLFSLTTDRPFVSRLIVFLLGSATTLAFAPAEWPWISLLVMVPLLFIALTASPRDSARHYFWFGLGLFLTGTYWIYISVHVFGNAALWIAIVLMVGLSLIMATFLSLAGWLIARFSHGEQWHILFVGPAGWVFVEWLRGWVLTGFPWLAYGYAHIDTSLAGWAPVLGVYGVSFMLVFSAAALLVGAMTAGRFRFAGLGLALLPVFVGAGLKGVEWTVAYGDPVRTTIVQAGVSQDRKWLPEQRPLTLDFFRGAALSVPDSELVVWPEVAIPALQTQVEEYLNNVDRDAKRNGQSIVLGILEENRERGAERRIYNSVFLLGTAERQTYRKRHLVPFGEYFPVPAWLRHWMKMQNLPHSDLASGAPEQPLLTTASGARLATAICYEDAYGAEQLYAFPRADILVNLSNDAWFGDSIAPHQHLQIARMRALEVGRFSVRATNTGISAFIGSDGKLLKTSGQFSEELITADIRAHRGTTFYANTGNWPVVGMCFLILGFGWYKESARF